LTEVTDTYYSDRAGGPRPRALEHIDETLWAAILALLDRGIEGAWFAKDFPLACEDAKGTYACDRNSLMATVRAEIPDLGRHLYQPPVPPTLAVLDLLEFMHRHACEASEGKYHSFYDHHHLRFDREAGQQELRKSANRLLTRAGSIYELKVDGQVTRLVPEVVAAGLRHELPATRDAEFDHLLEASARNFLDPDHEIRGQALEKLWDAFERVKTLLDDDKKRGSELLIATATNGAAPEEAELLRDEMRCLTTIGNGFRIRHHETRSVGLSSAQADHLFARMYAMLMRVHPAVR